MKKPLNTILSILLLTAFLVAGLLPGHRSTSWEDQGSAYVEPGLLAGDHGERHVIVTASQMHTAARAVQRVGGVVTSELWLIDAVVARVPSIRLEQLAATHGVTSILADKSIRAAYLDPYASEDWASERRRRTPENDLDLAGKLGAPLAPLPDGGVFALLETGQALIANPDGSERARLDLNQGGLDYEFNKPAKVDGAGNIYIASTGIVYKISPQGDILWSAPVEETGESFAGGVALGSDLLYVADVRRDVYAYDVDSGVREWVYAIHDDAGQFFAPPVAGEDGTLYCIGEHGHLTAIHPDGSLAWVRLEDVNQVGHRFLHSPVVGPDGAVYVNSVFKHIYAYSPDGSQRYHRQFDYQVFMAHPTVRNDGSLYIGSLNGKLYALEPDGSTRFTSEADRSFLSPPLLSIDGNLVFMTAERQTVLAFDAQNGLLAWEYAIEGRLNARTVLGPNGNLHFVDDQGIYYILTPQGVRVFSYAGFPEVDRSPAVNDDGVVFLHANHQVFVTLTRLLDEWDGSPDVLPGSDPEHVRLVYPFSIDTGADILHEQGLTGDGVTVAVVDSGVYFDQQTRDSFGALLASNYLGQADFYGAGTCPEGAAGTIQNEGYCQSDYASSYDGFGHGSHVAGIIWNNLKDEYTGARMGVAPNAKILSVRVLGDEGSGSYADVIEGIQHVVAHKDAYGIRVMNLSISAESTTPYFVDPINRAVEEAWAAGIVVLAAAGNVGAAPETITVPGNDPYVITVGSLNGMRTPGYWADDRLVTWASSGPTLDGFIKPDVLAPGMNIVSYMYNAGILEDSAYLVQQHPDYSSEYNSSLFRMNGTSMATAVASGVVALMLEHDPALTPDQVKFRLAYSALQLFGEQDELTGNLLRQGAGRLWAPEAVFAVMPDGDGNVGMDLAADLAHGWQTAEDILHHYEGPIRKILSDDGSVTLYYIDGGNGVAHALGGFRADTGQWLTSEEMQYHATFNLSGELVWDGGNISWESGVLIWSGGALYDSLGNLVWQDAELIITDGQLFDSEGNLIWSEGDLFDASGRLVWSGGRLVWSGANLVWDGGNLIWEGSELFDASGNLVWDGLSSLIWSGGYLYDPAGILVWSGGDLFDSAGRLVWSGGRLVWSGGRLVWSGGRLVWSGGRLVWSGGRLVWSGGRLVWSGGRLVWSGGRLVWSGSSTDWWESTATQSFAASAAGEEDDLVWAGGNPNWLGGQLVWQECGTNWPENFPTQAAQMHSNNWVNDDGTVEPLKQTFIHAIFLPITIS